eukprot:989082-Amphidinium_carterae.1
MKHGGHLIAELPQAVELLKSITISVARRHTGRLTLHCEVQIARSLSGMHRTSRSRTRIQPPYVLCRSQTSTGVVQNVPVNSGETAVWGNVFLSQCHAVQHLSQPPPSEHSRMLNSMAGNEALITRKSESLAHQAAARMMNCRCSQHLLQWYNWSPPQSRASPPPTDASKLGAVLPGVSKRITAFSSTALREWYGHLRNAPPARCYMCNSLEALDRGLQLQSARAGHGVTFCLPRLEALRLPFWPAAPLQQHLLRCFASQVSGDGGRRPQE